MTRISKYQDYFGFWPDFDSQQQNHFKLSYEMSKLQAEGGPLQDKSKVVLDTFRDRRRIAIK